LVVRYLKNNWYIGHRGEILVDSRNLRSEPGLISPTYLFIVFALRKLLESCRGKLQVSSDVPDVLGYRNPGQNV